MREAQQERTLAQARLAQLTGSGDTPQRLTGEQIQALVKSLGGLLAVLKAADPADKAQVYRQLGVRVSYDHTTRTATAEANPRSSVGVVFVSEGGV